MSTGNTVLNGTKFQKEAKQKSRRDKERSFRQGCFVDVL